MRAVVYLALLFSSGHAAPAPAIVVWDAECLTSVTIHEGTRMEAPLVAGQPDLRHAVVKDLRVTYRSGCEHIEVRK